jgi:hypothetical protein
MPKDKPRLHHSHATLSGQSDKIATVGHSLPQWKTIGRGFRCTVMGIRWIIDTKP